MILTYKMRHAIYSNIPTIELCGQFRDWNHFEMFKHNERFMRNWIVFNVKDIT